MITNLTQLKPSFDAHAQGHVFQYAEGLTAADQAALHADIKDLDLAKVKKIFDQAIAYDSKVQKSAKGQPKPLENVVKASSLTAEQANNYKMAAFHAMAKGQVAALLLAGGQGTRLGSSDPKGMYDIGLPSHKSMFQLQAERIIRLQELAMKKTGAATPAPIVWYVMCSDFTYPPTVDFFKKHKYFGLGQANVFFFKQGSLPALTTEGKLILESKSNISKAPDGNGGIYPALQTSGALADMARRGIQHLHVFGVDNVLVKVADPLFVGMCIQQKVEAGCKVVPKRAPDEPVGIFAMVNGKCEVVEYSELDAKLANLRDTAGNLVYSGGNICNHYFSLEFLQRASHALEEGHLAYHVARKKIKCVDKDGEQTTPKTPNGIKMELFIFDVFPLATTMAFLEVARDSEFSAVKNAPGSAEDSPDTARRDIFRLHQRWITAVGGRVEDPAAAGSPCEISPLVSYEGEDLGELCGGKTFVLPCEINPPAGTPVATAAPAAGTSCMGKGCSVM